MALNKETCKYFHNDSNNPYPNWISLSNTNNNNNHFDLYLPRYNKQSVMLQSSFAIASTTFDLTRATASPTSEKSQMFFNNCNLSTLK